MIKHHAFFLFFAGIEYQQRGRRVSEKRSIYPFTFVSMAHDDNNDAPTPSTFKEVWLVCNGDASAMTRRHGEITIDETSVHWTADSADGETGPSEAKWSTEFKQINLHAVGTDDSADNEQFADGIVGYVLVQVGDECDEIRLECSDRDRLWAIYNAFSEGVARNSADDDEDENAVGSLLGMLQEEPDTNGGT